MFRLPPPYLWTPPTPQCNNCDRRQRRKQGAVVGAAASKTRVPPKARSGCWVPQPVSKGYSPLTILKKMSKHKKASAAPVGAIALTLFSLLHLKPLSRCVPAPPRGSWHTHSAALSQKAALQMPFSSTIPPVKRQFWKIRVCAAMKAPVGLLSGRAVCASRWRGFAPTSSADFPELRNYKYFFR